MVKRPIDDAGKTRERLGDGTSDPLSPDGLRLIIANALKGQNYKVPAASRLEKLSYILVKARFAGPVLSELREAKAATEQVISAIDALNSALLRYFPAVAPIETLFIQVNNALMGNSIPNFGHLEIDYRAGLVRMDHLITSLREARASLYDPDNIIFWRATSRADRFNAYSSDAAEAFVEVMQAANPSLVIGLASNDGPLPRFLSAIAPHVSGESIPTGAVKARLKKGKQGNR